MKDGKVLKVAVIGILLLAAILISSILGGFISYLLYNPYQGYLKNKIILKIARGENSWKIANQLYEEGIIESRELFLIYLRINGWQQDVKAGAYEFSCPLSMAEVAEKLVRGDVYRKKITFPEGWTASRMFHHLEEVGIGTYSNYMKYFYETTLLNDITKKAYSIEGYLLPDTYSFQPDAKEHSIIATMIERFRKIALPIIYKRKTPIKLSVNQIVALASMIEKEGKLRAERYLIASVFYNRMMKGMKLQCDPTVIYAEWLKKGSWDGKINVSDLKRLSPYNTYQYKGLPPGAICNPGLESIKAACAPPTTNYLYFVSMNNDRHIFSSTLKEHNREVRIYQRRNK